MASISTSISTVEDYFKFLAEQPEPARYELYRGEPVSMSPVGYLHGRRVVEIASYLRARLPRDKYDVVAGEVAIVLQNRPMTIRGIDVAVMHRPDKPIHGALREPVLVAVEVVSPGDQSIEIERKRVEYEQFGIQEIWIVYEDTQTIHVSQQGENSRHFIASDQDVFQSVVGLEIKTQDLFV